MHLNLMQSCAAAFLLVDFKILAPLQNALTSSSLSVWYELMLGETIGNCCDDNKCSVCFEFFKESMVYSPSCTPLGSEPPIVLNNLPVGNLSLRLYLQHSYGLKSSESPNINFVVAPKLSSFNFSSWDDEYRQNMFQTVFSEKLWGDGETLSGSGSINASGPLNALQQVVETYNIESLMDIGCGDLAWVSKFSGLEKLDYFGIDIVQDIVNLNIKKFENVSNMKFEVLDIVKNIPSKAYDLILVKDVFIHLPPLDVLRALDHLSQSGSKFVLTSSWNTGTGFKENIGMLINPGDYRRINLMEPPFNVRNIVNFYLDAELFSMVNGVEQIIPKYLVLIKLPLTRDIFAPEIVELKTMGGL